MSEAEPTIADLFAKDPLNLTREERGQIIDYYRDNRVKFLQGMKAEKPAKAPAAKKTKGPLPDINLDDLEL